jgi:acyl-CoA reductase-like NAD-dependent aldehyde dehydrogenase
MSSEFVQPVNPATGKPNERLPIPSQSSVIEAVTASRAAFNQWRFTTVEERRALMLRAADILERDAETTGKIITSEMGRVHAESIPEVTKSAVFLRYFANIASAALEPTNLDLTGLTLTEKSARILYEPRGVAAIIKPWNAPVQQIVWALAPALMAGCTAIVKPSEYTPQSALRLQKAFDEAGFPDNVVTTLPGDGSTGQALVDADIDVLAFTGSVATGRKVAMAMAGKIRKSVLELSGKDALIVDRTAGDIELTSSGIVYGAFSNCGHWCSSVERAYLPIELAEAITEKVVAKTQELRVGPGDTTGVDVGPIANRKQFDIVKEIVDDAVQRGARVLCGGGPITVPGYEDGLFFEPTVLTDVPADARLSSENVFGPVVSISTYNELDEAIEAANTTNYGLGISLWTADKDAAQYVIRRSDTGMVWVNEPLQSLAACPWSVYKDSGIGVELGASGLREFTFEKVVQQQFENNTAPRPWYFPYK